MATYSNIGVEESSTETAAVASVVIDRGSTTEHQEIVSIGDPNTSNAQAAVLAANPASTAWGVVVRPLPSSITGSVSQASTTWAVQLSQYSTTAQVSSVGGIVVARLQGSTGLAIEASTAAPTSSQAGLFVRQIGYSTTAQISSVGGQVSVAQASTVWAVQVGGYVAPSTTVSIANQVRVSNSTIGELLASVQQNSTAWVTQPTIASTQGVSVRTSTGGPLTTSANPASTADGVVVRQAITGLLSTGVSTANATSSLTALVSSAAATRVKVFAYSVTSTLVAPGTLAFGSSGNRIWQFTLGSGSSGVTGANLAVTPPAYLFETEAAAALNFLTTASGPLFHVSVGYFTGA